ncbi:hypothetical protein KFL_010980040 [Klebsormidium nitens]|uniref:Uncharacterized protein n=1 Tax=Klebsormidium nitens TaxID=105231 RepID=A0A1Y1IT06_KLENI|nr:hypothetical protein KFL_010980040 [Klebsormidium nitens]|eukprot:GAQ92699.1 hypothetical protein KFL_010980040 [Klebsormidium nitens]
MLARLKWDRDRKGVGWWMRETSERMAPVRKTGAITTTETNFVQFVSTCTVENAGITEEGQLVFYDSEAVIALGDSPRKYMKDLFRAFTTENAQTVVDSLAGMGVLDLSKCRNSRDTRSLTEAVQAVMGQLLQAGNPEGVHAIVKEQKDLRRNQSRVFRPRLEFLYLLRNSGMVDATCRKLDPLWDSAETLKSILPNPPMDSALLAVVWPERSLWTPRTW